MTRRDKASHQMSAVGLPNESRYYRCWLPRLLDVARIERAYFRAQTSFARVTATFMSLWPALRAQKTAYARAGDNRVWRFFVSEFGVAYDVLFDDLGASDDLGNKLITAWTSQMIRGEARHVAQVFLQSAIDRAIKPDKGGVFYRVILNGRTYWFRSRADERAVWLVPICWPTDDVREVSL